MKMILISMLLGLSLQSGYDLDMKKRAAFEESYLNFFPNRDFQRPLEFDDAGVVKKIGFILSNIFGQEQKENASLHEILVQYISLNGEELKKKLPSDRFDTNKFKTLLKNHTNNKEKFLIDFFLNYEDITLNIIKGVMSLGLNMEKIDKRDKNGKKILMELKSDFSQLVVDSITESHKLISENEEETLKRETQPEFPGLADWSDRMKSLDSYGQYRYQSPATVLQVISSIDSKLQQGEVSSEQGEQLLERCATLVEVMEKAARGDLPLLKRSFADLMGQLRKQRWASKIADPSQAYMKWNAKLLGLIVKKGKANKGLVNLIVNEARKVVLGDLAKQPAENQKLSKLLSEILKRANLLPAFPDSSLATNIRRLFYMDVLIHSEQKADEPGFNSAVCQPEQMDRLLDNFAELIQVRPSVLLSHPVESLYTQFPEGELFFSGLKDGDLLAYLHAQLNALYAFRLEKDSEIISFTAPAVGASFDHFLDEQLETPELNLQKYYPLMKVVNGYTNLAPHHLEMAQKDLPEEAAKLLASNLDTVEFIPIRRGILAVFALKGPVYQRNVDNLDHLNEFKGVSFDSHVLLSETPIAREEAAPTAAQNARKNIVKIKAGTLSSDIIELLENTPNAIESLRNPALTTGLNKDFEYTFASVTRWNSPCKEEM